MTSQSVTAQQESSSAGLVVARALATDGTLAPVALRLTLAAVMFPHGAQKLLGWFGGYGFSGTVQFFESMGLPWLVGAAVVLLECFAPLLLLLGLATRAAALSLVGIMVGAIATVHVPHGFFMNWSGAQAGEGFEYHLLVIGMGLALAVAGSGRWGLDRVLVRRWAGGMR